MTQKINDKQPIMAPKKQCNWRLKLLILTIIVAVGFAIWHFRSSLWNKTQNVAEQQIEQQIERQIGENVSSSVTSLVEDSSELTSAKDVITQGAAAANSEQAKEDILSNSGIETFSPGPEPPLPAELLPAERLIPSFAPPSEETEIEEEQIDPYESIEDDEDLALEENPAADAAFKTENLPSLVNLHRYKKFVSSATILVNKIRIDADYSDELAVFKTVKHPEDIEKIVKILDEYQNLKNQNKQNNQVINLFNYEFLSRFIKVTKITPINQELLDKTREDVELSVPVLEKYVYDVELQNKFTK